MSTPPTPAPGTIGWCDLTVPDAERLRAFYEKVAGWTSQPLDMGGYDDHCMMPPGAQTPAAGVCHARGVNADLPPVWMVYITVEDVEAAAAACVEQGGSIIAGPKGERGKGRTCFFRDPAGAAAALYEPPRA